VIVKQLTFDVLYSRRAGACLPEQTPRLPRASLGQSTFRCDARLVGLDCARLLERCHVNTVMYALANSELANPNNTALGASPDQR
jgi:hypothetical protein